MGSSERVKVRKPNLFKRMWYKHKMWKIHRHAKLAKKYLQSLDLTMKAMGMPRTQVRHFWRDFAKYENVRANFLDIKE